MASSLLESLLSKCTALSHLNQIQSLLITTGQFKFLNICPPRSKLLELYSLTFNHLNFASRTFSQIPNPSTNDWNAILRGLIIGPSPSDAFLWYRSMLRGSYRIDALTCSFVLKACARVLALSDSLQLHSHVVRKGFSADALLGTTLLDLYAKAGDIGSAQKVFDEMAKRDIASWNALISGLAQGEKPDEALGLFKRIEIDGFKPNEITVLGGLSACSQLGAFKEGDKIYDYIRSERLDGNVQVCNAVIDMYAKCGFVDKAYSVFQTMSCDKSLVTWNTMIMAFAMHGDGDKALQLFHQMGPSVRMEPDEHYGSVVDLLGRAGRLQQAYYVIDSMPMLPDMVLWQTLLGACKTYKNVDMAEMVTRKLVEMGSTSDGNFVLLSNIYAAHERWADVGRIRDVMKSKDVRKTPGFSYIEEKGVIHKFYNADKAHKHCKQIHGKLEEIRFKMKEFGYAAETSFVLHDIGDEEKENALYQHSEKLAVAFGLICAEDEARPIQVIKNLRICGDCHVVIKLISKMYNREIIVRDRVRFHRFKDGTCSCRDYW
ncbi:unnamed protein product [Linum tenue]|uniref:DYW domain-containing protein n=1 Tax=Linum tenue TaxID=586396 RepID=A0AAV0NXB0_9ROSI|nr:unnamed protein product [Linum tenue]